MTRTVGSAPSGYVWNPFQKVWDRDGYGYAKDKESPWEDLRFPFVGNRIDVSGGRLDYNYFNGGVGFQSNCRYPNEPVSMIAQFPHGKKYDTEVRPHIHWLQQGTDEPNWLLAYKKILNGKQSAVETDFTNHTLVKKRNNAFEYTGGTIAQITNFPVIDTTGMLNSDVIHFVFFRDSNNTSGIFDGADPSGITEIVHEFDVHFQMDAFGSQAEFVKS